MPEPAPVLVLGRGVVGGRLAARLREAGTPVLTVARRADPDPGHVSLDLSVPADRAELAALLRRLRPACTVLAHGPGDVTAMERAEAASREVHAGVAAVVADAGVPAVLVSTDNVFPGDRAYGSGEPPAPANAYGRVKLAAEQALGTGGLALRVSLVYGWSGVGERSNFAERCLASARRGEPLDAPTDQELTPVHADDVATVLAALCRAGPRPGVAHLAGHREVSRAEFARLAYRLAGADEDLVRPVPRRTTEYASRPAHSSLVCDDFAALPGLAGWEPRSPADGLADMLRAVPAG
jgi:dTDP-4-dehydrorhamnose reductase